MENGQSEKKRRKGLFGLFHQEAEVPEKAEGPEKTAPEAESAPVKEELPEVIQTDFYISEGPILELWKLWTSDLGFLDLSLTGKRDDFVLPWNKAETEKEISRLKMLLERDARKRLTVLKQAAEKESTVDSDCQAYLSNDRMVAWVFLLPPSSPEGEFRVETIGKAMQTGGITTGIDSTAIARIFQERPYFQLIPVALGTPAVQGEDGKIIEHYPREVTREVKIDENGMADYHSMNYVQLINKGDVICDIVPPVEGTSGIRVDGKVIEPKKVRPGSVPSGRHTVLSEDGLQLLAGQDGHLQFSSGAFQVKNVLEIPGDVDYSTGNIEFNGDVHIRGDVRENFSVRATGTVTIDGLVEAAYVEAKGDLLISKGVLGNYKAVIKSWGCVRVKYLESCVVYAGKCVYADCIMTSQVFSDDSIQVTNGRGTIIGGTMTARRMVKATVIGTQANRKNEITLGVLPFVQSELESSEAELESLKKELQNVDEELRYWVERQGVSDSDAKLSKAQLKKSGLSIKAMQVMKRRDKLEPITPDLSQCRLECSIIYPMTTLYVGLDVLKIDTTRNCCAITYDDKLGEIRS